MKTNTIFSGLLCAFFLLLNSCDTQNGAGLADASVTEAHPQTAAYLTGAPAADSAAKSNYAKAITEKGKQPFFESIKRDITNGDLNEAKKKFAYINGYFPPKGSSGVDIYSVEEQKAFDGLTIDLKVHTTMIARHEPNPSLQLIKTGKDNATHLKVINQTAYPLTLSFSGVQSVEVNIAAGGWQTVSLQAGKYNSSASVSSPGKNIFFAGAQDFEAGDYQVTYSAKGS